MLLHIVRTENSSAGLGPKLGIYIFSLNNFDTYGISSEDLAAKLPDAVVVDGFENIAETAIKTAEKGDIVITMGGGDIYKAAHIIEEKLKNDRKAL